jgi:hypothetical protein
MDRETSKKEDEFETFLNFARRISLEIDCSSVRNGDALLNEPDILCSEPNGTPVGFELSRLTDPQFARMVNRPDDGEYARLGGHSLKSLREKLAKTYSVPRVELLLYRENIGTPDGVLIPQIKPFCRQRSNYTRIWFMSEKTIEILYVGGIHDQVRFDRCSVGI